MKKLFLLLLLFCSINFLFAQSGKEVIITSRGKITPTNLPDGSIMAIKGQKMRVFTAEDWLELSNVNDISRLRPEPNDAGQLVISAYDSTAEKLIYQRASLDWDSWKWQTDMTPTNARSWNVVQDGSHYAYIEQADMPEAPIGRKVRITQAGTAVTEIKWWTVLKNVRRYR